MDHKKVHTAVTSTLCIFTIFCPQRMIIFVQPLFCVVPLSEQSIELGNETVEFPDFTGGQWMYRKPVFALNDDY